MDKRGDGHSALVGKALVSYLQSTKFKERIQSFYDIQNQFASSFLSVRKYLDIGIVSMLLIVPTISASDSQNWYYSAVPLAKIDNYFFVVGEGREYRFVPIDMIEQKFLNLYEEKLACAESLMNDSNTCCL